MKTNEKRLVKISVAGEITHPVHTKSAYVLYPTTGEPRSVPMVGGITYNVKIGDSAVDWEGDHVEPGVSITSFAKNQSGFSPNVALNRFSCIGNEAVVMSGDAKGKKGLVVGKHGGIEDVIIDFPKPVLNKLMIGDKILIKAFGMGLKLLDFPNVELFNIDPLLLKFWDIRKERDDLVGGFPVPGGLIAPVTHFVPGEIMGSGLGQPDVYSGDYDIQMFDEHMVEKFELKSLKLGAFVAILNVDHRYGRIFRKDYISICVVVHSNSAIAGHGPGAMTVMTGHKSVLHPVIEPKAHLAEIFKKMKKKK